MTDGVSWGVGQQVTYARDYLEDGRFPICKPAVDHFIPAFNQAAAAAANEAGMDLDKLVLLLKQAAAVTARDAWMWATDIHPWQNNSGKACEGLSAIVDGRVFKYGRRAGKEKVGRV